MNIHMQHKALVKKSSKVSLNLKISEDLNDQIRECRIKAGKRDLTLDISNLVEEYLQSEIAAINQSLDAIPETRKISKKKTQKASASEAEKQPEEQPVQKVDLITSVNTTPTENHPNTNSENFFSSSLNHNDGNNKENPQAL